MDQSLLRTRRQTAIRRIVAVCCTVAMLCVPMAGKGPDVILAGNPFFFDDLYLTIKK